MPRTREERDHSEWRGSIPYSGMSRTLNEEGDMEIWTHLKT
jgi:hypothetical protein